MHWTKIKNGITYLYFAVRNSNIAFILCFSLVILILFVNGYAWRNVKIWIRRLRWTIFLWHIISLLFMFKWLKKFLSSEMFVCYIFYCQYLVMTGTWDELSEEGFIWWSCHGIIVIAFIHTLLSWFGLDNVFVSNNF